MPKKLTSSPQTLSFEQAMSELEQLVLQMEGGNLPLEASVAAYQRGSELVQLCNTQLDKVAHQVKVLEGGILKPLNADNTENANNGNNTETGEITDAVTGVSV
jgi:exodeoxyribonuclease VII small subunit